MAGVSPNFGQSRQDFLSGDQRRLNGTRAGFTRRIRNPPYGARSFATRAARFIVRLVLCAGFTAQHRFHQCLGLLKKHPKKTPPTGPVSTSIYASKSTSISTSIYTIICAIKWPKAYFPVRLKGRFPATAKFRTARGIEPVKDWQSSPRSGASKASVLYGGEAAREDHGDGGGHQ